MCTHHNKRQHYFRIVEPCRQHFRRLEPTIITKLTRHPHIFLKFNFSKFPKHPHLRSKRHSLYRLETFSRTLLTYQFHRTQSQEPLSRPLPSTVRRSTPCMHGSFLDRCKVPIKIKITHINMVLMCVSLIIFIIFSVRLRRFFVINSNLPRPPWLELLRERQRQTKGGRGRSDTVSVTLTLTNLTMSIICHNYWTLTGTQELLYYFLISIRLFTTYQHCH